MKIVCSHTLVFVLSIVIMPCAGIIDTWASPLISEASSYLPVTGPCNLTFPRDHGAHPGYRTEWWYYTGNVMTQNRERYGFQLTFFRRQISPPGAENMWPKPPSTWRTQHIFLAHAALSDIDGNRFYHAERMGRGAMGLAGARQESGVTSVFLNKWSARINQMEHQLSASADNFSFILNLRSKKEPVLHGKEGYSLKGTTRERASCYYSLTRLNTKGTMTARGRTFSVRGTAWMDHEFSSAPLEPDLAGWDWFSVQLEDDTEVMIYLLRQKKGGYSPVSGGTFVRASGESSHLSREDFRVEVLDTWKSTHTGARYPSRWRLRVHPAQLDITITSNLEDQEMLTPNTTGVTYWEGSVSITGTARGRPVRGVGYVELTGYDRPFDAPL